MDGFGSHLVRVMSPASAPVIFISSSKYTEPVIAQYTVFLNHRTNAPRVLVQLARLLTSQDIVTASQQAISWRDSDPIFILPFQL